VAVTDLRLRSWQASKAFLQGAMVARLFE